MLVRRQFYTVVLSKKVAKVLFSSYVNITVRLFFSFTLHTVSWYVFVRMKPAQELHTEYLTGDFYFTNLCILHCFG